MRALFTQLSLFIGLLTVINAVEADFSTSVVAFLGISATCAVYIALLLGDFAIHRFIQDKAPRLSSVAMLEEALDSTEPISSGDLSHAGIRSDRDALAA